MSDSIDPPGGAFTGSTHVFPLRVYFEDTDAAGIVYYANYLRFMERARSDMLRLLGIDQRGAMEAGEGVYVVAAVNIRYVRPARLDDALTLVSEVGDVSPASCTIHQRVMRGQELLAQAEVKAAFLAPGGRPRRQPAEWLDLFRRLQEGRT